MYNSSDKKQVAYSLQQLSRGLFFHLKYKNLESIPVSDICRKAGVTRRTYYRNCEEKTDLVLYSTDYLVRELLAQVDFISTDSEALYRGFFHFWEKHRLFLETLYKRNLFPLFLKEFVAVCNEEMRYPLQENALDQKDDREQRRKYSNAFTVGGLGQMLYLWTEEGFGIPAEKLAESIIYLVPTV